MKDVAFVIPCYNASKNAYALYESLREQSDESWTATFIDDISDDDTLNKLQAIAVDDKRVSVVSNTEKKYALRNIVETSRGFKPGTIIAVIDGDDQLCNRDTVVKLKAAHAVDNAVIWTAHKWDVNGMNISCEMPKNVDPYQFKWCSSHLRTFDAGLLMMISDDNFKNNTGDWFKRGYDQALMLPLLYKASDRVYISDVCYRYNINSCSMPIRDWTEKSQIQTVNFVRARGFVK